MKVLLIIDVLFISALLILGAETIIKIKRSSLKKTEDIREPLLKRINIIMVLTALTAVVTVIRIVINILKG